MFGTKIGNEDFGAVDSFADYYSARWIYDWGYPLLRILIKVIASSVPDFKSSKFESQEFTFRRVAMKTYHLGIKELNRNFFK